MTEKNLKQEKVVEILLDQFRLLWKMSLTKTFELIVKSVFNYLQ